MDIDKTSALISGVEVITVVTTPSDDRIKVDSSSSRPARSRRPPSWLSSGDWMTGTERTDVPTKIKTNNPNPKPKPIHPAHHQTPLSSSSAVQSPRNTRPVMWYYATLNSGWQPYDADASLVIEQAYLEFLTNPYMFDIRNIQSGKHSYFVDFRQHIQTNVDDDAHRIRPIVRNEDPLNTPFPPIPLTAFNLQRAQN